MAELADALDLGSSGETRGGSSPLIPIVLLLNRLRRLLLLLDFFRRPSLLTIFWSIIASLLQQRATEDAVFGRFGLFGEIDDVGVVVGHINDSAAPRLLALSSTTLHLQGGVRCRPQLEPMAAGRCF